MYVGNNLFPTRVSKQCFATYQELDNSNTNLLNIENYYKNNELSDTFICDAISYIFKNGYVDQYLLLETYIGSRIVTCATYQFIYLTNIDILDHILKKYSNIITMQQYSYIVYKFNFSLDVLYKLVIFGKLNINEKLNSGINFVKYVYYSIVVRDMFNEYLFMHDHFSKYYFDTFTEEDCEALLMVMNEVRIYENIIDIAKVNPKLENIIKNVWEINFMVNPVYARENKIEYILNYLKKV